MSGRKAAPEPENKRSPCSDAHYEAFIIQSKWTVDNLYASNVNLGQDYVKKAKLMEKQRKNWLLSKCREQQKMETRMRNLEIAQRRTSFSTGEFRGRERGLPLFRPTSRHKSLESLKDLTLPLLKPPKKGRSISQPCPPTGLMFGLPSGTVDQQKRNYAETRKQMRSPKSCLTDYDTAPVQSQVALSRGSVYSETKLPLVRKSFSVSTPLLASRHSSLEGKAEVNTELIPKYIPSKLRSRHSTLP